jgi:hypothetical protein
VCRWVARIPAAESLIEPSFGIEHALEVRNERQGCIGSASKFPDRVGSVIGYLWVVVVDSHLDPVFARLDSLEDGFAYPLSAATSAVTLP